MARLYAPHKHAKKTSNSAEEANFSRIRWKPNLRRTYSSVHRKWFKPIVLVSLNPPPLPSVLPVLPLYQPIYDNKINTKTSYDIT